MRSSRIYKAEGIVLKRKNVGEADRILTVFTKQYGKLRILAKGVRKITSRRAGHIEVFSDVLLTIHQGQTLDIVSEATSIRSGFLFDRDTLRLGYAYCMCELTDALLAERQEQKEIFVILNDGLNGLLRSDKHGEYQRLLTDFIHKILWVLGFLPHTRQISPDHIRRFVEQITERPIRSWPLSVVS